jgi:hypothetical protein
MREHVLEAPRRGALLAYFVAMTLLFGGAMGAAFPVLLLSPDVPPSARVAAGVVAGLFSGLAFGTVMTLVIAYTWAQHGGADQAARIARAIASGHVPEGVDPSTWDALLARHETWARRGAWLFTLEFAVLALLSAFLLALPEAPPEAALPTWLPWLGLAFFGALTIINPLGNLHRLRRIRTLRARLLARSVPS